jgi:hypothetical protein
MLTFCLCCIIYSHIRTSLLNVEDETILGHSLILKSVLEINIKKKEKKKRQTLIENYCY